MKATILWSAAIIYLALVVALAWNPTPFAQFLAVIGIAAAFFHAAYSYGWKNAMVLFALCLGITFAMENLGTTTGFPFGHYHFAVAPDLPHVGQIPIIVGPLWFGMGYFSWRIASTLLGWADRQLGKPLYFLAQPVIAAFVMAQWDIVMDPPEATISHAWIWHNGGALFGVPLSNFLGWLLTSWLFFLAFAIYLRRAHLPSVGGRRERLVPILFYVASGLTYVTPWLLKQGGTVTDAAGQIWQVDNLREATVAIMLLTMFFTALLAIVRLTANEQPPT